MPDPSRFCASCGTGLLSTASSAAAVAFGSLPIPPLRRVRVHWTRTLPLRHDAR